MFRKNNENYYGRKIATGNGKYVGGNISLTPNQDFVIDCHEKGIFFHRLLSSDGLFLPYDDIQGVSFKSEEEISKDVTLGRLLLFGVFAFGLKKKTVHKHHYIVMSFTNGQTAIFEVPEWSLSLVNTINSMKNKSSYISQRQRQISQAQYPNLKEQLAILEKYKREGKITQEQFEEFKKGLIEESKSPRPF